MYLYLYVNSTLILWTSGYAPSGIWGGGVEFENPNLFLYFKRIIFKKWEGAGTLP